MPRSAHDLTLEEQIGQLLMVGFPGTTPTPELIKLIQQYHIGNIIFFSRNAREVGQIAKLTAQLQQIAQEAGQQYPLLIAIDQENGMVQRLGTDATILPGNMALGAIGSEQDAYDVAFTAGQELSALGINLNLAPVVDVNNNPANPVIGVRSFGEDPMEVARLATAELRGYHKAGIATCVKHFPGHGDTATDSHLAMPTVPYTMERLRQIELVPFESAISSGTDVVMTAHIYFPTLAGSSELPATLSPEVISGLLRTQLGYSGIIMTDCLEMSAISETVGVGKGAALALQAGNDLILISHRYDRQLAGIEAIKAAVLAGEISREQIRQSAERIIQLKERLLNTSNKQASAQTLAEVGSEAHRQLSQQIYERSTTLVRDNEHLLPLRLREQERLLVVYTHRDIWTQVEDKGYPEDFLVESLCQRHANTHTTVLTEHTTPAEYAALYKEAADADTILMLTVNALLDARQAAVMHELLKSGRPLIGLAAYSPYDLLAFPELGTYLVTYEYTRPAVAAAVRVLFGEISPQGKLPVSLPELYPLRS
ncbi:MAG TPA: beta-N-acetylhexosaminidase [Ktedonobacteraceae bacterium]|nr:beta-N-acetylhexosaminidase [Ktedonobacteraceae bacterium]